MGQYFKAVNIDKKEVVCPWCLGGLAKLWEWAASPQGAIFTLLLRRSSGGGGGDFYDCLPRPYRIDVDSQDPEDATKAIVDAIQKGVAAEGKPIDPPENTIVGRWAGDRVCLVGDYDESGLFEEADSFRNISREVLDAWNGFIEIPDMQLKYNPGCSCSQKNEARVD